MGFLDWFLQHPGIIIGIVFVGILIWAYTDTKKLGAKTEGGKTEKKPYIFRSLLSTSDQCTHKCSKCGFGVVVSKYDMGVVCPECGNADDATPRL